MYHTNVFGRKMTFQENQLLNHIYSIFRFPILKLLKIPNFIPVGRQRQYFYVPEPLVSERKVNVLSLSVLTYFHLMKIKNILKTKYVVLGHKKSV